MEQDLVIGKKYKLKWAKKWNSFRFDGYDASGMVLMITSKGKQIRTSRSSVI